MRRLSFTVALFLALTAPSWCATVSAEAVRFRVQPEASEVIFHATSRMMNAEGRFQQVAGEILVDPKDITTAKITLSIEAGSIDTGIGMRDSHLRSEDFFDIKRFPYVTFESVRVEGTGKNASVFGRLTVHGVTREITVPVQVDVTDIALVARGEFVIDRREYGLTYRSFMNPIGNDVRVSFTFRARSA
jgi:polyisoprenoid-binding protein YceI